MSVLCGKRKREDEIVECEKMFSIGATPKIFLTNPIVPVQSAASKKLRKIVHEWLWATDNLKNFRNQRLDAIVPALNVREETKKVAEQLSVLQTILNNHRAKITFDEEAHEYSVNGVKIQQNVTTALEEIFGGFDADKVAHRMLNNKYRWRHSKYYRGCNFDEFGNELTSDECVARIKHRWEEARVSGTRLHKYIQQRYESEESSSAATPPATNENDEPSARDVSSYESWETIRMFNDWLLVACEYPVYSLACGLAGTIDAVYLPNVLFPRQIVLVDWKRASITTTVGNMFYEHPLLRKYAKGNYWKYAMQLNIYREILEKEYGLHVINMFLVSFPDDRSTCEVFGVPTMLEAKAFIGELEQRHRRRSLPRQ